METPDRDVQERRVGPTVSKEKWYNHARAKLAKGYVLIVGQTRRSANFYLQGKGFEMCAYNVAKEMIKHGIVVEAGRHPLGLVYKPADDFLPTLPPVRKAKVEDDDDVDVVTDDMDALINQLAAENDGQDEASAAA